MRKKVLIIANPGKEGAKNYCQGVLKDFDHYKRYFLSAKGGAWDKDEIVQLMKPSYSRLQIELNELKTMEYSMIVFTGHGYSNSSKKTMLELNDKSEEICEDELFGENRTLILDCCRKLWIPKREEKFGASVFESFSESTIVDRHMARMAYEDQIKRNIGASVVMYSCSINEFSQDIEDEGGLYSVHLLEAAEQWNRDSFAIMDVAEAHEEAKKRLLRIPDAKNQNPKINKPRCNEFYPFAVSLNKMTL